MSRTVFVDFARFLAYSVNTGITMSEYLLQEVLSMGQLTPLKLFPNFSVDFGDSSIATDSSIFVVDSLLHVMNLSLPIQCHSNAIITIQLQDPNPVCYRENNLIILSCDKNDWNQLTYQLAHEVCHLMIPNEVVPELRWLEESICELSSFFFLPRISKFWNRLGITLKASDNTLYAPLFEKYALKAHSAATALDLTLFSTCSAESELPSLVSDCYQRSKNKYISLCLLPIFERFPKTWHAIPCLSKVPAQLSFPDSLAKWIELSPTESHSGLQELALVFGVTIPLV